MFLRQLTPALLAGTLLLNGMILASPAEAKMEEMKTHRAEDVRLTSMDELVDVSSSHWAYDALRELVEKYDVIEGYQLKNGKFAYKGNNFVTRYEMAAALRDLLQGYKGGKLIMNNGDVNSLNSLKNELAPELASLDARAEALEARTAALESKVADPSKLLGFKLGGDFSMGAFGAFETGDNQFNDASQFISRLRVTAEVPVVADKEDSVVGEGRFKARLVAAVGNNNGGFSGFSRIAADASAFNEGLSNLDGRANSNNRLSPYFDRLVYEQDLKHGIPLLTNLALDHLVGKDDDPNWMASGTVFAGIAPWRDYFDKSAYKGKELTQFQNTSFVNTPGVPSNVSMPMFGYAMRQGLGENASLNVTAAFGAPNTSNTLNYYTANYEGRLNYNWAQLGDRKTSLYAGGVHTFNSSINNSNGTAIAGLIGRNNTAVAAARDGHTLYAGLDQEIYKGIGINVSYMHSNARGLDAVLNGLNTTNGVRNSAFGGAYTPRQALTAVLHVPTAALGFRDGDHFGFAYGALTFADGFTTSAKDRFEQVGEAYYTYYLNERLSLTPSVQMGTKLTGTNRSDLAFGAGLRASIKF